MNPLTRKALLAIVLIVSVATMVFILSSSASASTDVTGTIDTPITWDKDGGPYKVVGEVTITSTLTIDPGVEVLFSGLYSLSTSGGNILAVGTADEPINFTSGKTTPRTGDWDTISTGANGVFRNCTIKYGSTSLTVGPSAQVSDCYLYKGSIGLYLTSTNSHVKSCVVEGFAEGVTLAGGGNHVLTDIIVESSQQGFEFDGGTDTVKLERCVYNGTAGVGFWIGSANNIRLLECKAYRGSYGIHVASGSSFYAYDCTFESFSQAGINFESVGTVSQTLIQRCRLYTCNIAIRSIASGGFEVTETTFRSHNVGFKVTDSTSPATLHQNNFIPTEGYAEDVDTTNSQTNYDKNNKGNYWLRYNKADNNGDGIGDTPWYITGLQADNYPLMTPVDFANPVAEAGPDKTEDQHRTLHLDGSGSYDDTWIANYTWAIDVPGDDIVIYGVRPSLRVHVAGVFDVTLKVTDPVGHSAFDTAKVTIRDKDSPVFTELLTPGTVGAGEMLTFSARINDNIDVFEAWVMYKHGLGGIWERVNLTHQGDDLWSVGIEIGLTVKQSILYHINARDEMGNSARSAEKEVVVLDVTPPEIELDMDESVTTGDKAWLNSTITDNRGVISAQVEYWFGDEVDHISANLSRIGEPWVTEVDIPRDAASPMHLVFHATDAAKNLQTSPVYDIDVVDNDAPVLNLDSSQTEFHMGETATIRATISDNKGVDQVFVEVRYPPETEYIPTELAFVDGQWVGEVDVATTGVWIYYHFKAIDTSGNVLVTLDKERFLLSQRPHISTDPPSDAWEGKEYRVDFDADDPDNEDYEHQWSMETNATWLDIDTVEGIIFGTPQDRHVGWYWVNVTVNDPDHVSDYLEFRITVHDVNAPPEVEISFPAEEQRVGTVLKVSGRATDDLDTILWVKVRIDSGEWQEASGTAVWSFEMSTEGMEPGMHQAHVVAFDGESESLITSVSFLVPHPEKPDEEPGFGAVLAILGLTVAVLLAAASVRRLR